MAIGPLDKKMRALALSLISKYGKSIVVVNETIGEYDTEEGESTVTEATQKIKGVFTKSQSLSFEDPSLAKTADSVIMIAAQGLKSVPKLSDELIIDLQTWRVTGVTPVYSGEQICMYYLSVGS